MFPVTLVFLHKGSIQRPNRDHIQINQDNAYSKKQLVILKKKKKLQLKKREDMKN